MQTSVETKNKILEAARKHFIRYGFDGARMQAIADEAQVNKALLHYYFKDKQSLYQEVFEFAMLQLKSGFTIFNEKELTIPEKLTKFSQFCFHLFRNHSDLMIFILCEAQRSSDLIPAYVLQGISLKDSHLASQLQSGIQCGLIQKADVQEILITILGLYFFPILSVDFCKRILNFPAGELPLLLETYYEHLPSKIMNFIKL